MAEQYAEKPLLLEGVLSGTQGVGYLNARFRRALLTIRSGLQMRIAMTESVTLCVRMKS